MKQLRTLVGVLVLAGLLLALACPVGARVRGNSPAEVSPEVDHLQVRFLWPADPSRPGRDLKALVQKDLRSDLTVETPLGPATGKLVGLYLPSGELVAEAKIFKPQSQDSVLIFQTELKREIAAPTGKYEQPHFALPAIGIPHGYSNVLNFQIEVFVAPIRYAVPTTGPVVMYTDDFQVVVMSPLDNFMAAMQAPVKGEWQCGFGGLIEKLPAGTVAQTIVVSGKGVNATFLKWGQVIQAWHGHKPVDPYADVTMSRLGYWTDNGSYYYYRTEPGMNYHQTLLAVKQYADEQKIPYGYFQLDSWWYPKADIQEKSSHYRGGFLLWEPIPEMFPQGLPAFQKELGLPLVAHNRYCAEQSPYCARYACVPGTDPKKHGAYPTDPKFWDEIMDNAVKYGIKVYEQDWLYTNMAMVPWMRAGLHNAESWYDNMAGAAAKRGLTMQLCMASPEFFMQQLKHNNATHARVSHDYKGGLFKNFFWTPFHKASLFAYAVGMWPFKDNFQTTPGQSPTYNLIPEGNPWEEALIASLSGGPVGPSDKIGASDRELILRSCRDDGLLLKPDRPATPIDIMFLYNKNMIWGGKRPWIVTTESNHEIGRTTYLAAFNLWPQRMYQPFVSFAEMGLAGDLLVYNYRTGQAQVLRDRVRFGHMPSDKGFYYVLAPVLNNGMAVIGETGKFITLSSKRFPAVKVENGILALEIAGVPGERVTVAVYADHEPEQISKTDITEAGGDAKTKIYSYAVLLPASGKSVVKLK
jgi:hypothetical protein